MNLFKIQKKTRKNYMTFLGVVLKQKNKTNKTNKTNKLYNTKINTTKRNK